MKLEHYIIIALLVISSFFGLKWYLSGNDEDKKRLEELEQKYEKLEEEKNAIDKDIVNWKTKYQLKDAEDKKKSIEVTQAKKEARLAIEKANKTKAELDNLKGGITKTRQEIEDFKKNPPQLTDEQLLESLNKKLN
jgi:predicted  nucleic acid-binding Zn-ribbon protein